MPSTQERSLGNESTSYDKNFSQDDGAIIQVNIDNVAMTCSWATPNPETSYTCEVGPGKKLTKAWGMQTTVRYGITPSFNNIQVSRRSVPNHQLCCRAINHYFTLQQNSFQNFCWLHGCLVAKYGSVVVIPPIPERVLYGDLEDELIEKRRVGFQKFVCRICRHPVLSTSEAWKLFITETNDKVRRSNLIIAAFNLCLFSEMERGKEKSSVRCSEPCQDYNSSKYQILPEDTGVPSKIFNFHILIFNPCIRKWKILWRLKSQPLDMICKKWRQASGS